MKAFVENLIHCLKIVRNFPLHSGGGGKADKSDKAEHPPSYREGWFDAVQEIERRIDAIQKEIALENHREPLENLIESVI